MTAHLTATLRLSKAPHPRVLAATDSIGALLGFSTDQFVDGSVDWIQRVHPDDQGIVKRLLAKDLSPARSSTKIRLLHQDGGIRSVKLDYRSDLHDTHHAVVELQFTEEKIQHALTENELRFKTIFEQLPAISVQGYNQARQVIFWNHASEVLYGYTREQAMGRQLEDLIIPAPMREAVVDMLTAWHSGGPAIAASELTRQNADGQPVDVFSSSLSDLGIVGCKSTAAGYFSPLSYPISRYWAAKSSKTILAGADFRFRRPKPDRLLAA
ncbi:MAG: PAS domain-containing protein [Rhodoferax sp.]|nr:PAS domain-containing protein [Rhodoferax sp.]